MASLFLLASALQAQSVNDVTTWHNDVNRTGWQQNESILSPSSLTSCPGQPQCFGLLWKWQGTSSNPLAAVYAQPLAVGGLPTIGQCTSPCSLILIADSQDNVFAYNASSNSATPVWSLNLASLVGMGPVNCNLPPGSTFPPCEVPGVIPEGYVGVMGTPVIDETVNPPLMYVVAVVSGSGLIQFDLFAIDVVHGELAGTAQGNPIQIGGTIDPGQNPASNNNNNTCVTDYPTTQSLAFDDNHIHRSALLLLNGTVYAAFAPSDSEWENGWVFGYSYSVANGAFTKQSQFVTTRFGTGGGIWVSGSGPTSDGNNIFVVTGNGTWDVSHANPIASDLGDSVIKLGTTPTNGLLPILDYYTPTDVLTYQPVLNSKGPGRCVNDADLGSGGLMVFPDNFWNPNLKLAVNADKLSNIYVTDTNNLGQYAPPGKTSNFEGNNIETMTWPVPPQSDPSQGYWGSPAYWKYQDAQGHFHYLLYYGATVQAAATPPLPLIQYVLNTSTTVPPITANRLGVDYMQTNTLFCHFTPTPSVSSKQYTSGTGTAGTGILWGIEHRNSHKPPPPATGQTCDGTDLHGALHAFDATTMSELYSSTSGGGLTLGGPIQFSTPTVFQGRVYIPAFRVGASGSDNLYVFGLCGVPPNPACTSQ